MAGHAPYTRALPNARGQDSKSWIPHTYSFSASAPIIHVIHRRCPWRHLQISSMTPARRRQGGPPSSSTASAGPRSTAARWRCINEAAVHGPRTARAQAPSLARHRSQQRGFPWQYTHFHLCTERRRLTPSRMPCSPPQSLLSTLTLRRGRAQDAAAARNAGELRRHISGYRLPTRRALIERWFVSYAIADGPVKSTTHAPDRTYMMGMHHTDLCSAIRTKRHLRAEHRAARGGSP